MYDSTPRQTDWNVSPNQRFYVKISDIGSQMRVELFNTPADAGAGTDRVASANVDFDRGSIGRQDCSWLLSK
jgi:hypothetical protein